jgi:hypothetical protein
MPTTWDNIEKSGGITGGWSFNEVSISFNQVLDVDTFNTVFFNGLGLLAVWTNLNKI